MEKTIVLRFRDLSVEKGGTIAEHANLLNQYGEVWWGWWMKQDETSPKELFRELANKIQTKGSLSAFLFDSGYKQLYSTDVSKILISPTGRISTPDPEKSPSYYHRGTYPAWLLLRSLKRVNFEDFKFTYESFPTRPELSASYQEFIGKNIPSLDQMKQFDITLWVVEVEKQI
jgi:hypothetical protein